jgi:magnesium-transporting ATPase (P-type)
LGPDGRRTTLDDTEQNNILTEILYKEFTTQGLRAIAFAYRDLSEDEFNELKSECNNFLEEQDREVLEKDLTFVGVFAL